MLCEAASTAAFWQKVAVGNPDDCWEWQGTITKQGYGRVTYRTKHYGAHRCSLSASLGRDILPGLCALHSCDNRRCVNPAHLREGTVTENNADARRRDRLYRWNGRRQGSGNPRAKLTPEQVVKIRAMEGSCYDIAEEYGVNATTIQDIRRGISWQNVRPA